MQHSETTVIDRPSSVVWELVGDPHGWPAWADGIQDVTVSDEGPLGVGSEFSYTYRGKQVAARVAHLVDGSAFGFATSQGWYEFSESIALEARDGRTAATFTMGFEPTTWWGRALATIITPLRSVVLGRSLRQGLRSLKEAAERASVSEG